MAKKTTIANFALELKKELEKLSGVAFKQRIARQARDILYNRVKSGFGIKGSGKNIAREKLKALSPLYIESRKSMRLGKFGSPGRSNITLTGETLEAISIKILPQGFALYFTNQNHPVHRFTFAQIANYVEEGGRPFFNLTTDERRIIEREVELELRKLARRF